MGLQAVQAGFARLCRPEAYTTTASNPREGLKRSRRESSWRSTAGWKPALLNGGLRVPPGKWSGVRRGEGEIGEVFDLLIDAAGYLGIRMFGMLFDQLANERFSVPGSIAQLKQ